MTKSSFCSANNSVSSLKAHLCVVRRNTCLGTEAGDKVAMGVLGPQGGNACIWRVGWQYIVWDGGNACIGMVGWQYIKWKGGNASIREMVAIHSGRVAMSVA